MIQVMLWEGNNQILQQQSHPNRVSMAIKGEYSKNAAIVIKSESKHLWVQVDQAIAPALVYLPLGEFEYRIPQNEQRLSYPPQAFLGEVHLILAWLPSMEERTARRNLACNPADQRGEFMVYPHATANVETRNEAVFAARNVIDGWLENISHGEWPYQSWGIGAREDAWCMLEFGRPVRVDQMVLILRADFPHDAYWKRGTVRLSDGAEILFALERTGEPQRIELSEHIVSWMRLENLIKSDDPSAFPALTEWEVYGTEVGE